jgi:4-amino-4-deoxy-L-arabinose transferase-like glycosyltransferase
VQRPGIWLGLLLAAAAYLYHLDSLHVLNIGDEPLYVQITRVTGSQGALLPLRDDGGINDTKPPLLFWQGILSTGGTRAWNLWRLRLPIVLYTAVIAALIGFLAFHLSRSPRTGALAALLYLGSFSTFQHGRPFLTNAPETLYLFLPLVLCVVTGGVSWPVVLAAGASIGLATLYKSFFLVVPVTAALALIQWRRAGWRLGEFLQRDALRLAAMAGLGLGMFGLWFLVDPRPDVIVRHFIVGENLGKFASGNYLRDLVSGFYPVTRIWLADFLNLGFYLFPLAGLLWLTWRRRTATVQEGGLAPVEVELWLYVLAFLVVYTVPRQRQENYVLPTVAALAVLLALNWERLAVGWLRASLGLVGFTTAVLLWAMGGISRAVPGVSYSAWQFGAVGAVVAVALFGLSSAARTREYLPAVVVGALFSLGIALSPFDRGFEPSPGGPGLEALRRRTIWFPSTFTKRYEIYRFQVPGSEVSGYAPPDGSAVAERREITALAFDLGAALPAGFVEYGRLLDLRTRLPNPIIWQILAHGRFDLWVYELVILQRTAGY